MIGWRPILGPAALLAAWATCALLSQSPDPSRVIAHGAQFDDDFIAVNAASVVDAIALQGGSLTSASQHSIPLEIEYEIKGDGFSVMLGYAADRITFQPEPDPTLLKIDGGPAGGQDVAHAGSLSLDHFVTIRQTVTESAMDIAVDGVPRASWKADFSGTTMPVKISNAHATTLLVRSIRIRSTANPASAPATEPTNAPPLQNGLVLRGDSFDDDFIAVGASRLAKAIVTRGVVESARTYEPPLSIDYRVKTDSTNVRLGYGADEIIFNWEMNPDELRIGGGPAGGHHVVGKGRIPVNEFVTIRQVVHDDRMEVLVDGKRRAEWKARFRDLKQPIRIFAAGDSTLTIESVHIKSLVR